MDCILYASVFPKKLINIYHPLRSRRRVRREIYFIICREMTANDNHQSR